MSFESLGLMPILLKNVHNAGYETPTPIQTATIPLVLSGKDVLGCAQTGTGKTAAFALPMLQHMAKKPVRPGQPRTIRQLILTPTRELAMQIYENFVLYGKTLPVFPAVIFGGVGQQSQVDALHRGCDTVIACPGRLWDLMNQGYVRLDFVETFVLDEADRMLDMGFIHDVRRIAAKLPEKHQTLLFSATMPDEVEKLAMDLLHEPETVKVDPVSSTVKKIDQSLYYVDKVNKKHLLAKILRENDVENALVFSRTRHGADRIVRELKHAGIDAAAIHGDKSQAARQTALNRFKSGESKVLVATDIAARGIDIAGLSHVINYDMPMEPEAYVHRIGRTGRAGRDGTAISFCCIDEVKQLGQVEKLIGKRLAVKESEWPMEVTTPTDPKEKEAARQLAKAARLAKLGKADAMPKKISASGNAIPERKATKAPIREQKAAAADYKPRFGPGSEGRSAERKLPANGQAIVIGRDGKVSAAPKASAPAKAAMKPAVSRTNAAKPQHKNTKPALGKPVQRVNRGRSQNGKRG